jgi:transcriptional antiterminator/mannitol/fructose-specific phosphotransferase system IIA component (Ntr-type)
MINKLIEEKELSLAKTVTATGTTKKQVLYSIDRINEYLSVYNQGAIKNDGKVFHISPATHKFLVDQLMDQSIYDDYILESEERSRYIFFLLFFKPHDFYSIDYFLYELNIGRTTFMSDLKKLQGYLANENIEVANNRQRGYYLAGNEYVIRSLVMRMILEDFNEDNGTFFYDYFLQKQSDTTIQETQATVEHLLAKYNITLLENRLKEFCYTLTFLRQHLAEEGKEFYDRYNFEVFEKMNEYDFSVELLAHLDIHNKQAALYLCSWVLSLSLGKIEDKTYDQSIILEIVNRMTARFELLSGIRFVDKKQVTSNLYSHFRSVYYRLFFKIPIINSFSNRIYDEYPAFVQIVEEVMKPISALFEFPIPREEIAYLSMHFLASVEHYDELAAHKKTGVVVCPNGIGSSAIVLNELKNLLPEYNFIGPYDTDSINDVAADYDYIFSTVQNVRLYTLQKPVFVVHPFMTPDERYNLIRNVYSDSNSLSIKFPHVSELIAIFNKHGKITDQTGLEKELYLYLSEDPAQPLEQEKENEEIELKDILKPEYIKLQSNAKTFAVGVQEAAEALLQNKVIEQSYLDHILETIAEKPTSMMITDTIALPHTKPIYGAKSIGISLVVLKEPIRFEDKALKYIFLLSATDSKKHLTAISQLVKLIERPSFFEELDKARDAEKLYEEIIGES